MKKTLDDKIERSSQINNQEESREEVYIDEKELIERTNQYLRGEILTISQEQDISDFYKKFSQGEYRINEN